MLTPKEKAIESIPELFVLAPPSTVYRAVPRGIAPAGSIVKGLGASVCGYMFSPTELIKILKEC